LAKLRSNFKDVCAAFSRIKSLKGKEFVCNLQIATFGLCSNETSNGSVTSTTRNSNKLFVTLTQVYTNCKLTHSDNSISFFQQHTHYYSNGPTYCSTDPGITPVTREHLPRDGPHGLRSNFKDVCAAFSRVKSLKDPSITPVTREHLPRDGPHGSNSDREYSYNKDINNNNLDTTLTSTKISYIFGEYCKLKLLRSGDVERNPGPTGKLLIGSYNVRGCNNYNKLKRLLNYIFKIKNTDRFIYSLHETHVSQSNYSLAKVLWREGIIMAPSINNARGVLTFYSNGLFDNIIYEHGTSNGRSTWLIGQYNNLTEMFVSLYAPNSGKNAEFYNSFFDKIKNLVAQYKVDNVYILGDFNLVFEHASGNGKCKRKQSFYEKILTRSIVNEMEALGLDFIRDQNVTYPTWCSNRSCSVLDYIVGPKHIVDSNPTFKVSWGIDKSDHAALSAVVEYQLDKGKGMFRPYCTFLDNLQLKSEFLDEVRQMFDDASEHWDPHTKLEYFKVVIRTLTQEFSVRYKKRIDDRHTSVINELTRLHCIKLKQCDNTNRVDGFVELIESDITSLELELEQVLEEKTKMLASKSRTKWLELGEISNKYFLNINKSYQNQSYYKSFIVDGVEISDNKDKLEAVYKFYAELYEAKPSSDPSKYLNDTWISEIKEDHSSLYACLNSEELLETLKKCGNTAAGPDGIGYKILKAIWPLYAQTLIDSWNYGLESGCLSDSHRESVICLLEKKNKDKKYIHNLRPISLSNCDIKIITKVLTKRFNSFLPELIGPHQAAYIKGRQVHDNLRTIDLVKSWCLKHGTNGYLVSLDAKKAFDSVDHKFIVKVLERFRIDYNFIKIFKVLYHNLRARVQVNGFHTANFPVNRSVKQGDALSCVLFILCMEVVITNIQNNSRIKEIRLNGTPVTKVLAYADDVALITSSKDSITECIKEYEEFSKHSGLWLNVDKTEVLNLLGKDDFFYLDSSGKPCNTMECVTICGRMFAKEYNAEYKANVTDKINKFRSVLNSWKGRSLTIFGRNLIIKTFGLSQLIYSMQNMTFSDESIKSIEKIYFEFIWNRKANKSKAYERIARNKLKMSIRDGGIGATDLKSMNLALKVKQLIQSSAHDHKHCINYIQS